MLSKTKTQMFFLPAVLINVTLRIGLDSQYRRTNHVPSEGSGVNSRNDRLSLLHCPPTTFFHVRPCLLRLRKPRPHPTHNHFEIDA